MNELSVRSDARSRPAILIVDPTLGGVERTRRRVDRPLAERMHETDQCAGVLDRGRLVRSTNLERSEPRMWADVPPEARVVARQAGRHHPLDETLPLRVIAECRRDRKSTRLNSSHTVISYAVF